MASAGVTIRFNIKKPTALLSDSITSKGKRKTFAIIKATTRSGRTSFETLKREDIEAINQQYKESKISLAVAEKNLRSIKRKLEKEAGVYQSPDIHNSDNEKILERYWAKVYGRRRIIDKPAAWAKLHRAVRSLGNISLLSADAEAIEVAVLSHNFDSAKTREILMKLQSLLDFVGRDVKLNKPKPERPTISYLTESELQSVVAELDEPLRSGAVLSFYTGLRMGELFALTEKSLATSDVLSVRTQVDRQGKERATKNQVVRQVYLPPQAKKAFEKWIRTKDQFKMARTTVTKHFKKAAKAALKRDLTWHDLRHSFAVFSLSKGLSLTLTAQALGDSVQVTQTYYAGFSLSDESMDLVRRTFRS